MGYPLLGWEVLGLSLAGGKGKEKKKLDTITLNVESLREPAHSLSGM